MKRLLLLSTLALTLAMGAPAFAQDPDPNTTALDALSPGGMKIVDSIYDSHVLSDSHLAGMDALTKNDFALMKADTGWGNAYNQLRAANPSLVHYRNLG